MRFASHCIVVDKGSITRADTPATNTTNGIAHAFDQSLSYCVADTCTHANTTSHPKRWSVWPPPAAFEEGADRSGGGDDDVASIDNDNVASDKEYFVVGIKRNNRGSRSINHGQGKKCVPAEQVLRQRAGLVQCLPAW